MLPNVGGRQGIPVYVLILIELALEYFTVVPVIDIS